MKIRQFMSPLIFIALLVGLFMTTQLLTRSVMESQVQAAEVPHPGIQFVPISVAAPVEPEELLLPTMIALQQQATVTATATLTPTVNPSPTVPPPAANSADQTLAVPQQGGTCISGAVIDHYHQPRGQGFIVEISDGAGAVRTTVVGPDGRFRLDGLAGGVWQVRLEIGDNSEPFTAESFPVTLSGVGNTCAEVRFKIDPPGCVEIIKLDKNGPRPNTGLPDWKFTGTHENGQTVEGVTDGLGHLRFDNLRPGRWTFEEELKAGWVPAEGESPSQSVTLAKLKEPQQCPRLTFVNEQKHDTCVTLRKTDDRGQPLSGWRLELTRDDGTFPPQSGLTDEKGEVTFNGLPLGDYTASETVQAGYLAGGPTSVPVSLTEPSPICQVITFENPPSTCIDGHKINHLETGLPGWELKATHKATGQMFTTTTNASGYFVFPALPLGTYIISETLQAGWINVTPTSFEVIAAEPRLPGECYPVRFKNRYPYACLDVYKVDAYDGAGIPAWNMTLRPAYGGEAITLPTDGIGHVRFDKLTPGDYILSEENKPGWFHVTEPRRELSLEASGICEVVTFENCQELNKDSEQCQR